MSIPGLRELEFRKIRQSTEYRFGTVKDAHFHINDTLAIFWHVGDAFIIFTANTFLLYTLCSLHFIENAHNLPTRFLADREELEFESAPLSEDEDERKTSLPPNASYSHEIRHEIQLRFTS